VPPSSQYAGLISPSEWVLLLNVPYRTQFDGSLWQSANCGPASLGTVLEAYGIGVSTQRLRDLTNQIQGTSGYRDGTAFETLRAISRQYGLQTAGPNGSNGFGRWSTAQIRERVSKGWPVITLVRYRSLPWNRSSSSESLHYIVVVGTTSRGFFIHDVGAARGGVGKWRVLSTSDLERAWADSGFAGQAIAIGPQSGELALPIARLLGSEFLGRGPIVFGANKNTDAAVLDTSAPLPPDFATSAVSADVAPLPPSLAPLPPSLESRPSALASTVGSSSPLSQIAKAVSPRLASASAASDLARLAPALSDRWSHPLSTATSADMFVEPALPTDLSMSAVALPDPTLVLSARDVQRTDHTISLYLMALGLGGAIVVLKRRDEV
jgi:hypothetical protein